jgi:hypothetical protein
LTRLEEMNERRQAMVGKLKGVEKELTGLEGKKVEAHFSNLSIIYMLPSADCRMEEMNEQQRPCCQAYRQSHGLQSVTQQAHSA